LSVDPLTKGYPFYTPYQFAGNNPIWAIDLDGLEERIVIHSDWYKSTLLENKSSGELMDLLKRATYATNDPPVGASEAEK
jgi:hypothetical protein